MRTGERTLNRLSVLVSLIVVGGVVFSTVAVRVAAQPQGAHLWLTIDPGLYVFSSTDPWLVDSWVDPLNYVPNGIYAASLTVSNQGFNAAETYLLVAIPNSTTPQMFSSVRVSGGADGTRTYVLMDFGRTDYNPYTLAGSAAAEPIVDTYRPQETGSHGVYPPSGNANWATYFVGTLAGSRDPGNSLTLQVTLNLGPVPDNSFKVHFDGYSLIYGLTGPELQYWVPPSHDANMASETLLHLIPAEAVDVSGNNNYVAVGWGRNVTFFETFAPEPDRLRWTRDTGHQVFNVVLSENGGYLAVTSNEVPLLGSSHAYLSLYRTSDGTRILHQQLDHNAQKSPRSLDISRNGTYVAVGTAGWAQGQGYCRSEAGYDATGSVYLLENPDIIPGATVRVYSHRHDCTMTVRFSGNGLYLVAGFWWDHVVDVIGVPNLNFLATTTANTDGDVFYAVAVSYDGRNISTGQGIAQRVKLWRFTPGTPSTLTRVWTTTQITTAGTHSRQVVSDDGGFIFTKQESWPTYPSMYPAFHLFNSTVPDNPNNKLPVWTYTASYRFPTGVDMSVSNPSYAIGAVGLYIHIWGNGSVPLSSTRWDFLANDTTTDAAMAYSGPIGPVCAATDNNGYLYVFIASLPPNLKLFWYWHTPT